MEFVQIVDFETDRMDEMRALVKQLDTEMPMQTTKVVRSTFVTDRDHPNHHMAIVEFRNYDDAMENSADPRVSGWAERMAALCTSPPKFVNLDVVERMPES